MTAPRLLDHHLEDLRRSGLSDETIRGAGLYSATNETTAMLVGFGRSSALAFPYLHTATNGKLPFTLVKFDKPDAKGKRYAQPKGSGNRLYIPPTLDPAVLRDPRVTLYITEGEKKCLKAVQEGLPCVSVSGVDSWRSRVDGKSEPIPDLDRIVWKDRTVYIVYDSDLAHKAPVRWAEYRLARELRDRGAKVFAIRLPGEPNGEKVGLDDYLCTHSVDTFCAIEPEPITHPEKALAVPSFPVVALGDFVARDLPQAPDLLGHGTVTLGSLVSLVGRAKLGKTWVATHLGLAVAGLESHWLSPELPVRQHGPVLYINAEVAEPVFQRRLKLILGEAERRGLNTALVYRQFFPVTVRGLLQLDRKAGEEALLKLAEQVKPVLIVLDPIGPLHGWDENSADEMGRLLNLLLRLCQQTGAAIVFVHHAPKSVEGREEIHYGRGSSVFGDRVDSALSLISYGEQGEGSRVRLSFILRNGPPREPLVLWRGRNEYLYRAAGETVEVAAWLRDLVTDEGEIGRAEAFARYKAAGFSSEWQFKRAVAELEKAGVLHRDRRGMPARGVLVAGPKPLAACQQEISLKPSPLLKTKDSLQSGGASQSGGPQTVEILSSESGGAL